MSLRVNDEWPLDNDGSFTATVRVHRLLRGRGAAGRTSGGLAGVELFQCLRPAVRVTSSASSAVLTALG
ncbi:hypothetical protein [Nonomuraea sp. NPDC049709]|uniref:hypothetical protein n=1 Tax=Nonomuraea sp. NPDC049709 TaxID=3154736 RepID=UPI0034460AAB